MFGYPSAYHDRREVSAQQSATEQKRHQAGAPNVASPQNLDRRPVMRPLILTAIGLMVYGALTGKPGLAIGVAAISVGAVVAYVLSPGYGDTAEPDEVTR